MNAINIRRDEGQKPRILIISPVRNEADYLQITIDSIAAQSLRPVEWIIVDDGSTDQTPAILKAAADAHPWIRVLRKPDRGHRAVGPGVVEAFYYGFERAQTEDYDYVCKLDGDLEIPAGYFARLMEYFDVDEWLGAASGKPYIRTQKTKADAGKGDTEQTQRLVPERMSDDMVAGMINFYRRDCFEKIGGFVRQVHWDGIAFHAVRMAGFRTRSIDDPAMRFVHLRLMGSSGPGIWTGRQRWGRGQYFMGTHPLYLLAIVVYRMLERPFVIGGLGILAGYMRAWLQRMPRYELSGFRRSLHAYQFERLRIGRRLAREILPPASTPGSAAKGVHA